MSDLLRRVSEAAANLPPGTRRRLNEAYARLVAAPPRRPLGLREAQDVVNLWHALRRLQDDLREHADASQRPASALPQVLADGVRVLLGCALELRGATEGWLADAQAVVDAADARADVLDPRD